MIRSLFILINFVISSAKVNLITVYCPIDHYFSLLCPVPGDINNNSYNEILTLFDVPHAESCPNLPNLYYFCL